MTDVTPIAYMVIERPGPGEWRGPGQAERRRRSAHELAKKFRDLEDPDLAVIVQWLKCNPSKHYRLYRSGLFDHIYDGEPEGESCPLFAFASQMRYKKS